MLKKAHSPQIYPHDGARITREGICSQRYATGSRSSQYGCFTGAVGRATVEVTLNAGGNILIQ